MLGQAPDQRLADAGLGRLGVDRQTPQGRAVLGIGEGAHVIDAGDRADHRPRIAVLGHQIGQVAVVAVRPEEVRRGRHHAARRIDPVDRLGVLFRHQPAHREAARLPPARPIGRQVQPEGVRRIEKHLLRGRRQQDVRIAHIQGDIAPVRPLGPQRLDQRLGVREGLGEQKPAPAAVQHGVLGHALALPADQGLEALVAQAFQPVGRGAAGANIRRHGAASTSRPPPPATAPSRAGG